MPTPSTASIYDDDPDALETLTARIAEREAKREKMKTINKLYRKADAAGLAALGIDLEELKTRLAKAGAYWGSAPHLPYELSNLGGCIAADRKRLEYIKQRQQRAAAANAAPNGIEYQKCQGGYCRLTFAEKPDREILDALKAAGFSWGAGSWVGKADQLPANVAELVTAPAPEIAAPAPQVEDPLTSATSTQSAEEAPLEKTDAEWREKVFTAWRENDHAQMIALNQEADAPRTENEPADARGKPRACRETGRPTTSTIFAGPRPWTGHLSRKDNRRRMRMRRSERPALRKSRLRRMQRGAPMIPTTKPTTAKANRRKRRREVFKLAPTAAAPAQQLSLFGAGDADADTISLDNNNPKRLELVQEGA